MRDAKRPTWQRAQVGRRGSDRSDRRVRHSDGRDDQPLGSTRGVTSPTLRCSMEAIVPARLRIDRDRQAGSSRISDTLVFRAPAVTRWGMIVSVVDDNAERPVQDRTRSCGNRAAARAVAVVTGLEVVEVEVIEC
jgi:hypothetical protein